MYVHKKSANMSKFSLINLMGMSECWEALLLPNLSMSFFMSSMLISAKRSVSFSQLLRIASMLGWSLYLKTALKVGSAMFSVAESNSLFLEILRFFLIFEKKLFGFSAVSDSGFNIWPFSLILILSLMRDLSESKGFTDFQNSLLLVTLFMPQNLWNPSSFTNTSSEFFLVNTG